MTIGEVAARSGVTVSALRFYEGKGLIAAARTSGNQRRFPRAALRRIAVIRAAQSVGISLERIQDALAALPEGRAPTASDWAQLSQTWRDELDEHIAELIGLRDRLSNCIGCGCLSLDVCKLYNPDDKVAVQGAGAHLLAPKRTRVELKSVEAAFSRKMRRAR